VHEAMQKALVRACHDLSEGGLAVAVAEMAFAGGIGVDLTSLGAPTLPDHVALFSESTTRFVVEVRPDREAVAFVKSYFFGAGGKQRSETGACLLCHGCVSRV
jgi:phosphoribosylformylglycinamidine (FGAM) synthase-like enzyme